jgi:curved DNA-binding protein CbpA
MAMATPYVDPYAVLGVTRSATPAEIKQAYFALVRAHPPEREPDTFKRIRAAYERLRDPERRTETDMLVLTAWPGPARQRRAAQLDLALHAEDVLAAARTLSDLERRDWREHFAKVQL